MRWWRLGALRGAAVLWLVIGLALGAGGARAEGVELTLLTLQRLDAGLTLDFNVRMALPRPVEEALQRGVPLYFAAEATL